MDGAKKRWMGEGGERLGGWWSKRSGEEDAALLCSVLLKPVTRWNWRDCWMRAVYGGAAPDGFEEIRRSERCFGELRNCCRRESRIADFRTLI